MATNETKKLLPSIFQTETNEKFLGATIDNLVTEPNLKVINGFVGRKFSPEYSSKNEYVREPTISRTNYQLEPSVVVKDPSTNEVVLHRSYQEIIQDIRSEGGIVSDPNKIFSTEYVSYNPQINVDAFVNYFEYYWVPNGPALIEITESTDINDILGNTSYTTQSNISFTNGLKVKFTGDIDSNYKNKEYYVEGVGESIELIPSVELSINQSQQKSTYLPTDAFTYNVDAQLNINESSDKLTIVSTGLPDNQSVFANISNLIAQPYKFIYPYRGGLNDYKENDIILFSAQTIAVSTVGIPFYGISNGWTLSFDGGAVKTYDSIFSKITNRDEWGGERSESGAYIYRDATPILANAWGGTDGYSNGYVDPITGHSKIIGFAADGYPIYGPYGYDDPDDVNSNITRMVSSYVTSVDEENTTEPVNVTITLLDNTFPSRITVRSTTGLNPVMRLTKINNQPVTEKIWITNNSQSSVANAPIWQGGINQLDLNVPFASIVDPSTGLPIQKDDVLTFDFEIGTFIQDYVYESGRGHLDEFNGRFCITPEFPLGTYAYFLTVDENLEPQFPYVIGRTYRGSTTIDVNQSLTSPNYLVINRGSQDRNPWSRRNRWFHKEVIELANKNSDLPINFEDYTNAKRPIIEFNKNLQLFNYGSLSVGSIDLIDFSITDTLSTIQLQEPTIIDGITVINGMRIVFANENDLQIRNKIWEVEIVTLNGVDVVKLNEVLTVSENNTVIVFNGNVNVNKNFWFDGNQWKEGQRWVDRTSEPLFDVVDDDGISFSNNDVYPSFNPLRTFNGTKIFNYIRADATLVDPYLGFSIKYRNLENIGDIEFRNGLEKQSFDYRIGEENFTKFISSGFLIKNKGTEKEYLTTWTPSEDSNHQYQIISYTYDGVDSNFIIDIDPVPSDEHNHFEVYVNYELISSDEFVVFSISDSKSIVYISRKLVKNDKIDFVIFSDKISQLGYYEVPENLEFNPLNQDFRDVTLGEMRNHIGHIARNSISVTGKFPGSSNLRDLNIFNVGGTIVKQSNPLSYAALFLAKNQFNFINSINKAKNEYASWKNKILTLAESARNSLVIFPGAQREALDLIIDEIIKNKNGMSPWYSSDMIPFGKNYNKISYTVIDSLQRKYPITEIFNDQKLSNRAILVYINNTLAVKDADYVFDKNLPLVVFNDSVVLDENSTIDIFEYSDTDGNFLPETPTKLGLFPKYKPEIIEDISPTGTRKFIRGHDGSLTLAFNDFRDDVLLEFETRIYNNIKVTQKAHLTDFYWKKPGKFRNTNFNLSEFNAVLSREFYNWIRQNNIEDYTTNTIYKEYQTDVTGELPINESGVTIYTNDPNRFFSYNYKNTKDLDGEFLPGSWRACFDYYYDTYTPHLTPWEMLGFSEKPDWWEDEYGPAPYTSGNQKLWDDLENGVILHGERAGVDLNFSRPGLSNIIPVTDQGILIPPANLFAGERKEVDASWIFGNWGPVEWAWRRSAEFRFAWQVATALTDTARYFSFGLDTQNYIFDQNLKQYVISGTKKQITKDDIQINSTANRVASYLNWISDSLILDGIIDKSVLKNYIDNHSIQLSYRMAGFSDKSKLKIIAEQYSPQKESRGILIPDDDYDLTISESAPILNAVYSAVKIERVSDGYKVSGYDLEQPYFNIVNPDYNGKSSEITVVNQRVKYYEEFLQNVRAVYYNTVFKTTQQVVNFLTSYQRYLELIGFEFDEYDQTLQTTKNWQLSIKEFLFWSQQGWGNNSLITLSPVGSKIKYRYPTGVVSELQNTTMGSKILNQNGEIVPKNAYSVFRRGNDFSLTLTKFIENNISFAKFYIVQQEHVLILKNQTQFKDTIYNPLFGQRQFRIKIVGKKTANWNGSISPEGFIINQDNIEEWSPNTDYKRGTLISFKYFYYVAKDNIIGSEEFDYNQWKPVDSETFKFGLLPNFSTISGQSKYYFDVDRINLESEFDRMSLGLIGYRNRNYFSDYGLDDSTQVKLYQGITKQKGSKNSIDAVGRIYEDVTISEEWAFKLGEYGYLNNNSSVDIRLSESLLKGNPVPLTIGENGKVIYPNNRIDNNGIVDFSGESLPTQIFAEETKIYNAQNRLKTAGFVNYDDVEHTLFSFDDTSQLDLDEIKTGETIWVAVDFTKTWNVFKVVNPKSNLIRITNLFNSTLNVEIDKPHGLSIDDVAIIKTDDEFRGFYQVVEITNSKQFVINFVGELPVDFISSEYEFTPFLFLQSVKVNYPANAVDIMSQTEWVNGDKIWTTIPNTGKWEVIEKTEPWVNLRTLLDETIFNEAKFGNNYAVSDDNLSMISVPLNVDNNYKFLNYYIYNGTNYEFLSKVELPSFLQPITQIQSLNFKTNYLFVLCVISRKQYILIFRKIGENLLQFQQILQVIATTDTVKFSVSDDENYLYFDTKDFVSNEEILALYSRQNTQTKDFVINITDQLVYQIDNDVEFDFVEARSSFYTLIKEVDYQLFEEGGNKFIRFSFLPPDEIIILTAQPKFLYDSKIVINGLVKNLSCDSSGEITIAVEDGQKTLKVFGRAREKYIYYSSITPIIRTTLQLSTDTKVFVGTVKKTYGVHYTLPTPQSIQFTQGNLPQEGSIITIEFNELELIQELETDFTNNSFDFGNSIEISKDTNYIYASSPLYSENQSYEIGIVERWANYSLLTNKFESEIYDVEYTTDDAFGIKINDHPVIFNANSTIPEIVQAINDVRIPGIITNIIENAQGVRFTITNNESITGNKFRIGSLLSNPSSIFPTYTKLSNVKNPTKNNYDKFGQSIIIDDSNKLVMIGSPEGTVVQDTTFELIVLATENNDNETTFDGDSTRFKDKTKSGCIWNFTNLMDSLNSKETISEMMYVNQLHPRNLDTSTIEEVRFSEYAQYKNGLLVVGAPDSSWFDFSDSPKHGVIYYVPKVTNGWSTVRTSSPSVDLRSINRLFIYSNDEQKILYGLDYIDPINGKILGIADQDINYKTEYDPAVYNNGSKIGTYFWNDEYVGNVWWDLSTVRFVDYQQGDIDYKSSYWAKTFDGSSIDIYEWVESDYPPALYQSNNGEGIPKSTTDFTTIETVDEKLGIVSLKYYFWVRGKTTVPNNVKNRRLPTSTIAQYIETPISSGVKFLAPIAKDSFSLYNVYEDLVENDRILKIYYNLLPEKSTNNHVEYALLNENTTLVEEIPPGIVQKLVDSISGIDQNSLDVPDTSLPLLKRYGILDIPRQSLYTDVGGARFQFVTYLNSIFKNYKLSDRYDLDSLLFGEILPSESLIVADDIAYDEIVDSYSELLYINTIITPVGYRVLIISDENTEGIWAIYELDAKKQWNRVRCQSFSTQEYWEYINWWAEGYDDTTIEQFTFADYNDFQRRAIYFIDGFTVVDTGNGYSDSNVSVTISGGGAFQQAIVGFTTTYANGAVITSSDKPTIENGRIVDVNLLSPGSGYISQPKVTVTGANTRPAIINASISTQSGRIIKILNDGTGRWNYIKTNDTGYEIIGIERGTISLSRNLWDSRFNELGFDNDNFDYSRFDKNQQQEIREIFFALKETIFANQIEDEFLKLFFFMMKYVLVQQKSVDWMFKTSFINVKHILEELNQRKIYSPRDSDMLREYINEVKPYKTVVKDYVESRNVRDNLQTNSTDFDISPYFDATLQLFRSPQYQEFYGNGSGKFQQTNPQDTSVFDDTIYDSWKNNFTYYISDVVIVNNGEGFTPNEKFVEIVESPTGDNAEIEFTIGTLGSIVFADVIKNGSGFITTPTLELENGAKVFLRVDNDLIRKFTTKIKYDRVSYGREPREWIPNTEYKQFEIIRYFDVAYARNLSLSITGDEEKSQVFNSVGFDGVSSPYDFYGFDQSSEDIFVPGRAWIALRDFNSGDSFKDRLFIKINGEVEQRIILEPYTNYISIRVWQPNTEYYRDQIVVHRATPYLVLNRFTSGSTFIGNNLDSTLAKYVLESPENDNASNRILVYYDPTTGRPGRDLSSLMAGIDYPGIITQGIGFESGGGFDVAAFDIYGFDLVTVDESGNQVFAEAEIDSIVDGLGFEENTEDAEVILDGDGYITPEYSYAPEEMLPGRVYDTMDMKILTLSVDATDTTYITWINGDAYTLSGFFGNGGSNIANANLTLTGYTVSGNVWLETNIGNTIQTNTVVINNLPIVANTIDISNISIPVANSTQWISVTNIVIDTTAIANTTVQTPKLWANLTQNTFTDKFNYHIWKDKTDFNQYLSTNIATTTTLVSNLRATLTCATVCGNIQVGNASVLPEPVIIISNDDIAAEALNRRMDPNSVNIIDTTNYNFSNLVNAVYEVYGNVQVYQSKDQYIIDETVYNPQTGIYKKPGVIMINGERMEYWSKFNDTNMLVGVRRGTGGTSVIEHSSGEKIYDYTRIVPGAGFLQGENVWIPEENTVIQTQRENTFLNFDELVLEDGSPIVTESDVPIATDGTFISGISTYTFEDGEKYIRTKIFNLPTPGPNITTEDGDIIVLDGSPETALGIEPPLFPTDGKGLYNSGISSPNTSAAVFVVNSLYDE